MTDPADARCRDCGGPLRPLETNVKLKGKWVPTPSVASECTSCGMVWRADGTSDRG